MEYRRKILAFLILFLLAPVSIAAQAAQSASQDQAAGDKAASDKAASENARAAEVVAVASARTPVEMLADRLAGVRAASEAKQYGSDNLAEIAADKAAAYKEYRIIGAASREYSGARIDLYQTESPSGAFGLFSYSSAAKAAERLEKPVGADAAWADGSLVFWKGNYFVRVSGAGEDRSRSSKPPLYSRLASALAEAIPSVGDAARPSLLESLPSQSVVAESRRYFLGPESLSAFYDRARDAFHFEGHTEAVMAEYAQPAAGGVTAAPLKLLVIEYHTPNFATDAMARAAGFVESLPDPERNRIIIEREGNFIVAAVNVDDRQFAQQLIDSVEYPYTVKWLRNPLWATSDPFRAKKAATMLLSTFGLLGLMIAAVLVGGAIFGSIVFLKRRKQQRAIFSDAGGMLRLEIDPFERVLLGLPPKRSED